MISISSVRVALEDVRLVASSGLGYWSVVQHATCRDMWGVLSPDMVHYLASLVGGKVVWDLGAGNLGLSILLHRMEAEVTAIDYILLPELGHHKDPEGVVCVGKRYDAVVPEPIDVAFLSWPTNYRLPGLIPILEQAETVVYLGSNFDGTCCGFSELFKHLRGRKLLKYLSFRRNSMVVVGESLGYLRTPTPEEAANGSKRVTYYNEHIEKHLT